MKNKKLIRTLSLADASFIEEARPKKRIVVSPYLKYGVLAACFCAIVGLNMWLFMPFAPVLDDVSMYKDSDYYEVITLFNNYYGTPYKNNFEKLVMTLMGNRIKNTVVVDEAINFGQENAQVDPENAYIEVTDNQIEGVTESDIIKRSDKYIYYLSTANKTLNVYSIQGLESAEVGSLEISGTFNSFKAMYLSEDCQKITIIKKSDYNAKLEVVIVDVSDPTQMKVEKTVAVSGDYSDSRITDGKLYVAANFYVNKLRDYRTESHFIPQISVDDGEKQSVEAEDIICPNEISTPVYTVIYAFDTNTYDVIDSLALLSYESLSLVSSENMYVLRQYENEDNITYTDIARVSYRDGDLECKATYTVEGYINNQYYLDEYNSVLRVVTTTENSANLYCISLESGAVLGEVKDFAPEGETVESVRFDGDTAYVCTAEIITLTDPVFFFDLSDLNNITYKDTGIIEGYSTSLVDFADSYLLGIGVGSSSSLDLKLEIYEEAENKVVSVCSFEKENVTFSSDYKSYYIDRENRLIGLCYSDNVLHYTLLYFDGEQLSPVAEIKNTNGCVDSARGVYIDGYLYVLTGYGIDVAAVDAAAITSAGE